MSHWDYCESPLCVDDCEPELMNERTWFPDEPTCNKTPFTKWQKAQHKIRRMYLAGKLKHGDERYFTIPQLNRISRITPRVKGSNPDKPIAERLTPHLTTVNQKVEPEIGIRGTLGKIKA